MGMWTDDQWTRIEAGIGAVGIRGGKPRADDRQTIEGILWRFANGAKWRSVPAEFGPWHRVAQRFRRWAVAGVWEKLFEILKAAGEAQLGMVFLDGTVIRAHQKAAGARRPQEVLETAPELKTRQAMEALGRSKGGFGTKAVGLCDGAGRLLALELLPGQADELEAVPALFDALPGVPIWTIGDKGYDAAWFRDAVRALGSKPAVPSRKNAKVPAACPRWIYNNRNRIERCWSRLKEWRAIATRSEKTAVSFRAGILLAASLDWIKSLNATLFG